MKMRCVFCEIIAGELSSKRIFEDPICVAFLDIHPINPGHVLVVPRRHVERFYDLSDGEAAHLSSVAKEIYKAIRETDIRCEGANIFLSDGAVAGQEVMHCHLHVTPRFSGDGHKMGFSHADPEAADDIRLEGVAGKIRSNLIK